jgi:hypothetical protein
MAPRHLDGVSFERLLSFRPVLSAKLAFEQPPVRDMVFDFYNAKYLGDAERANATTKEYLDAVWQKFGAEPATRINALSFEGHFFVRHSSDKEDRKQRKSRFFRSADEFRAAIKEWNEPAVRTGHGYLYTAANPIGASA